MSQALNLQKPFFIFVLLLIDLSLAMRIYPTYAPAAAAAWSQQQRQKQETDDDHARQQRPIAMAAAAATSLHGQSVTTAVNTQKGHWKAIGSKRDQSLDPPHIDATPQGSVDCRRRSSPSSSSHIPDCSKSPAPEEAEGSEIDPRYGVEKRLVPTGPNPLHN